jgi:MFS family permease
MLSITIKKSQKSLFFAGMIGNVLDHYDLALYTFLVPFIAPEFFQYDDPIIQLILAYGITAVSIISRPLGSIIFGKMAITFGAKNILVITLTGVAISTCALGFIPGYNEIGTASVILLVSVRFIQGFFASGEQSIAGLFILDQVQIEQRAKASSYYMASGMTGAMLASGIATIVSMMDNPSEYWRYAFMSGIVTGIVGIIIRFIVLENHISPITTNMKIHKIVIEYKSIILRIIFVSSFSYMTYLIPFVFLNKFVPLFTTISFTEMMAYNSLIMVIDILLLPIFGHIAQQYNVAKWMMYMSLILGVSAIPAFFLIDKVHFYGVMAIKLWFVVIGLAYAAPMKAWLFSLVQTGERYMITGLGYSIGTEVLGRQTTTICWLLWHKTNDVISPAYYIICLSICTILSLYIKDSTTK